MAPLVAGIVVCPAPMRATDPPPRVGRATTQDTQAGHSPLHSQGSHEPRRRWQSRPGEQAMTNAAADDLAGEPAEEPPAGPAPAPSAADRGAQVAGAPPPFGHAAAPGGAACADPPAQGPDHAREEDAAGRT